MAQVDVVFRGKIKDVMSGGNVAGATVQLYKDGKLVTTVKSSSSGKFEVKGPVGHNYEIRFSKNGYVSRKIQADFTGIHEEDMQGSDFELTMSTISLIEDSDLVDFSALESQPFAVGEFDDKSGMFSWNMKHVDKMKRLQNKLIDELEDKKKAAEKDAAAQEKRYLQLVKDGDDAVGVKSYEDAVKYYEEAKAIKDDGTLPPKIANAKKLAAQMAEQKKQEEAYNKLFSEGENLMASKEYEKAKLKFAEASKLLPNRPEPAAKIKEIDGIIANQAALQKKYDDLITKGDAAMSSKTYDVAITSYSEALKVFPGDAEATKKRDEAEKAKADADQAAKAEQEKKERYAELIALADKKFSGEEWNDAKSGYQEALKIYDSEQHPKARIEIIDKKLKELEEAQAEEKAKKAEYEALIAAADGLYDSQKYEEAQAKYEAALGVYADKKHPKDRIEAIKLKLKELADKEAADKAKKAKYDQLIAEADNLFDADKLSEAKTKYEAAIAVMDEDHPKDRIEKINEKLKEKEEAEAKAAEELAQKQKFDKLIAEADKLFDSKDFSASKSKYEEALGVLPNESHPKQRIDKIDGILKEIQDQENAALAEKEKQEKYDRLVQEGDDLFSAKKWAEAKSKYESAINVIDDEYPRGRIKAIDKELEDQNRQKRYDELMAKADKAVAEKKYEIAKETYTQAYQVINDQNAKDQIDYVNELISKQAGQEQADKEYQKLIDLADKKFDEGEYQEAIGFYERSKTFKPDDPYPDERIAASQKKIGDLNDMEVQYNKLVAAADSKFEKGELESAKADYNSAIAIFDREYPRRRLADLEKVEKELADKEASEQEEKDKEARYTALIEEADQLLSEKDYERAKDKYKEAHEVMNNQDYPQEQIDHINKILVDIQDEEQAELQYKKIVDAADKALDNESFDEAEDLYKRANSFRPEDPYPLEQIAKIEDLKKAAASRSEQEAIDKEYDDLIAKADDNFDSKNYQDAKNYYKQALKVKQKQYPQDQIQRIDDLIESESQAEANAAYEKIIAQADKDYDSKSWESAKNYYTRATKLKPDDPYPAGKLLEIEDILNGEEDDVYYGEQVANDVGLMSGEALIQQAKANRYNRKVDSVLAANHIYTTISETEQKTADEKRFSAAKEFDQFAEDIRVQQDFSDERRQENIDVADSLQRHDGEWREGMAEVSEENRNANHDSAKDTQDKIDEMNAAKEGNRQENIDKTKAAEEEIGSWQEGKTEMSEENRNANHDSAKDTQDKIDEMNAAKEGNRQENIDKTKEAEGEIGSWREGKSEMSEENRNANHESAKDTQDKIDEMNAAKEGNRQENIDKTKEAEGEIGSWREGKSEMSEENRNANHESAKDTQDKIDEMNAAKEGNRQENIDKTKEAEGEIGSWREGKSEMSEENRNANHESAKDTQDKIDEMNAAKEGNRQENIDKTKEAEGEIGSWREGKSEMSEENRNANQESAKDTQDKIDEMNAAKEGNRQENIDSLNAAAQNSKEGVEDRADNQQKRIESNEDFFRSARFASPEVYTTEYKDDLARKYEEGVTTMRYEKKDANGDVYEIVIRKVVVQNGKGNDYVLYINSFGRTYYRNGMPISKYHFQNETTGLKKNN